MPVPTFRCSERNMGKQADPATVYEIKVLKNFPGFLWRTYLTPIIGNVLSAIQDPPTPWGHQACETLSAPPVILPTGPPETAGTEGGEPPGGTVTSSPKGWQNTYPRHGDISCLPWGIWEPTWPPKGVTI